MNKNPVITIDWFISLMENLSFEKTILGVKSVKLYGKKNIGYKIDLGNNRIFRYGFYVEY